MKFLADRRSTVVYSNPREVIPNSYLSLLYRMQQMNKTLRINDLSSDQENIVCTK